MRRAAALFEVAQELMRDGKVALLVRVRHVRSIHPLPRPLDRSREINRIFDDAGINQRLPIRTDAEAFGHALPRAARERRRQTDWVLFEIGRLGDERVSLPVPHGMTMQKGLAGRRMLPAVKEDGSLG